MTRSLFTLALLLFAPLAFAQNAIGTWSINMYPPTGGDQPFDRGFLMIPSAGETGRMVLFKFPSAEKAQAWYNDPDYQALSEHRRAGTRLEFLTMLHGLPPRG